MEGHPTQTRERSRPPYPRTASRSSSTRITSQSSNSLTSHISSSPKLQSAHPAYRLHHASSIKPSPSPRPASRPTSRLSRNGSIESGRQTPASSFLQEKLQRERQVESQKYAAPASMPRSNSDMSASFELGNASSRSPTKRIMLDANRPQSTSGVDPSHKKGLALKEMEKVVSGLHKQNFDLKLELYHRRERQTMLEERLEKLESEKAQQDAMNTKLLEEMEKRDRAIEEAVGMIVMLEASVADLTKERDMVRQVEAQGFYSPPLYQPRIEEAPPEVNSGMEEVNNANVAQLDNEANSLNHMPSFVSDRSEKTETLRNVYLGTRGSVISLSRMAQGSSDVDNGHFNGMSSPALSVLSESSFVSIYGQKGQMSTGSPRGGGPLPQDRTPSKPARDNANAYSAHKAEAPSPAPKPNSFSRKSGQFQPIASIIEGSPLQRIERMDSAYSQRRETPRPTSSGKSLSLSESSQLSKSSGRKAMREEKRESLRKVVTDSPGGVSLNDQALPPTPDTIASSTLRRFKNSNDTLGRRHDGVEGRSEDSLPQVSKSNEKLSEPLPIVPMEAKARPMQTTKESKVPSSTPHRGPQPPQRPRSAGESTASHRKGSTWDSDDDSDTDSLQSSLDIWLRAGSKSPPNGRASPDLFGFPTNTANGSWSMKAMFRPQGAQSGGASVNPDSDQMHDLFSAQQALFGNGGPPPTPNRRSSLNAQTGPNGQPGPDATPVKAAEPPANVENKKPQRRRQRHFRRNSDDAQMRANMKTPVPGQLAQPPPQPSNGEQKRNHYPPITGHHGARASLGRLFRRSLGGTPLSDAGAGAPSNAESVGADSPKNAQQPGAPTWVNRSSAFDVDRTGATPPPILRNRQGRGRSLSEVEGHGVPTAGMDGALVAPTTGVANQTNEPSRSAQGQVESNPAAGSATGARRKWLPAFGRSSGSKKSG